MPSCRLCKRVQATAEVRRTRLGHVCKDKLSCARRARANKPSKGVMHGDQ